MSHAFSSRVDELLKNSELDSSAIEKIRGFFDTIAAEPQFPKILDLLEKFPNVFENFIECFLLKEELIKGGISKSQWQQIVDKEDAQFRKLQASNS